MIKSDRWIEQYSQQFDLIEPYILGNISCVNGNKAISFGTSSYGYDIRLHNEFKIFTGESDMYVLDPKQSDPDNFQDFKGNVCVIPPNSFVLARSLEWIRVPRDILVTCLGKSTYARCGVFVNVTPLEPEWEGYITMSISNTSPMPCKLYANEGIAQLLFWQASESCRVSYADKNGKYQRQTNITTGKV